MDEEARAADHLRILAICNFVCAALSALGSCAGLIYIGLGAVIGRAMEEEMRRRPGPNAPPQEVVDLFTWLFTGVGIAVLVVALTIAVLCLFSGLSMARHRARTFSLVVAGLQCLSFPIG